VKIKYIAEDGKEFDDEKSCREHEATNWKLLIADANSTDLERALAYDESHRPLAAALEQAGRLCGEARREAGDLKRTRRGAAAGESAS
jgi:hypothetical protein